MKDRDLLICGLLLLPLIGALCATALLPESESLRWIWRGCFAFTIVSSLLYHYYRRRRDER